ncbi:MAG: penicillin acylase family protein [Thermoanaerobaculales bacterium]|jgi:penicillin amidase|nr:penicillin acylase family protein [Thermoanaerobaculales bacterium]
MKASIWKLSLVILAVAAAASGQTAYTNHSGMAAVPDGPSLTDDPVSTTRDAQGIWFIEGGTLAEVMEAMGYAVATDRLWQMDLQRRQGRGTLSALLGPSQIPNDVFLRTIGHTDDELTGFIAELSPDAQTLINAYTAGINRRIGEFYAGAWMQMPYEYWLLGLQSVFTGPGLPVLPQPFTPNDTLAWLILLQRNFDPEGRPGATGQLDNASMVQALIAAYNIQGDPTPALAMFADLRWINDPGAQTMIPSGAKTATDQRLDPGLAARFAALPDLAPAAARIRSRAEGFHQAMEALNVDAKMGSYAWAVAADKAASGNPTVYSGPQMGFSTPSIVTEGSIRGGGLEISGMTVPGIPFIIIGRTPHHAWSMQVGHAHTVDYYLEAPQTVSLHRMETIEVFGRDDVVIPVWRSAHGPIIEPLPWDPTSNPDPAVIVAWAYAHWGREAKSLEAFLRMATAESVADFDAGIEEVAVSQHFTYADADGNIAYWMSGFDPIRAAGVDPRLPSIGDGTMEWTGERRARAHDSNTDQGYYGGWNNKASVDYNNAPNAAYYGRFHRAHVIDEYLAANDDLSYEQIRDLALNIATTDSFGSGGNTWPFVADAFSAAVAADPTPSRQAAVDMIDAWDGHFVAGGPAEWRFGTLRADAWVLQDAWIREMIRLTFEDEFTTAGLSFSSQSTFILFNVLVRMLDGPDATLPVLNNWFADRSGSGKPTTAGELIVLALDNVLGTIGSGGYNAPRGEIVYTHQIFGEIWRTPFSSRSTYAHCVEFDSSGPVRIESMFPLGESGEVLPNQYGQASFNPHFFSMIPAFDPFMPRPFPLFD